MAQITINEISQNYTYNIGANSFATVALPITAMWGPCYMDPEEAISDTEIEDGQSKTAIMLERTEWMHFPATQEGLESFVSTYRGPSSNYKLAKDYSYQMAMTLLTAGYDVLVCRVCPGTCASVGFTIGGSTQNESGTIDKVTIPFGITAKYPGSFGNNLRVSLSKIQDVNPYWNLITYIVDSSGIQTAVENLIFRFDPSVESDNIPHIDEVESKFFNFSTTLNTDIYDVTNSQVLRLSGGSDTFSNSTSAITEALAFATTRYHEANLSDGTDVGRNYATNCKYLSLLKTISERTNIDDTFANTQKYKEWVYNAAYVVYGLLQDKLNYNPQRIISPGWDDQDIKALSEDDDSVALTELSPLHCKIMETAYYSRCATGMIDIPRSEKRGSVYNSSTSTPGYAQKLARISSGETRTDINAPLYPTHSALFAPWGSYQYVGTNKQYTASPSFLALMIQRAMILNQSLQYEWALPMNRRHNLNIGKMDYKVPKKLLDEWQKLEGVGVNVITNIPDLGLSLWGNSTLYEVPPATYQALANLSTRYLVNAVEDTVYRCGISITFQYNNEQAYNTFYAGVTPLLDTMKNVGAIEDYYVKMAADVNGLDQVNANSVIGKIYLSINGVINDIDIDLIALPPGTDLNQYRS